MTTADRDIFDIRVRQQPSVLTEGGELYWGNFKERVQMTDRPNLYRPIKLLG
jgi:hypothetical protein